MKFIVTQELGRLAKWLRILGFDTLYFKKNNKAEIAMISLCENRVIITRGSHMSRFTGVRMIKLDGDNLENQLKQVIEKTEIKIDKRKIFTICVECDTPLDRVQKKYIKGRVPEYVYKNQRLFMKCPKCSKIYWQGSHRILAGRFLREHKI